MYPKFQIHFKQQENTLWPDTAQYVSEDGHPRTKLKMRINKHIRMYIK